MLPDPKENVDDGAVVSVSLFLKLNVDEAEDNGVEVLPVNENEGVLAGVAPFPKKFKFCLGNSVAAG